MICKACPKPVPEGFKEFCSRECFKAHLAKEGAARKERYAEFKRLYAAAHEAGLAAGNAARPEPMVLGPNSMFLNGRPILTKTYVIPDGPCGFGWVTVRPGNCSFAKWCAKNKLGTGREYDGGFCVKYVGEFGQSLERKTAYADAFADVLNKAGITAYGHSRID